MRGKLSTGDGFTAPEVTRVAYTTVCTPSVCVTNVTNMPLRHWQTATRYCNSNCKLLQQKVCEIQTVTVSHTVPRKYCTTHLYVYRDTTAQGLQQYIYMCKSAQYIRYNSLPKSFLLTIQVGCQVSATKSAKSQVQSTRNV